MLATTEIQQRLKEIDILYLAEANTVKALLWAKLATLEVGGWTEECIDKIVIDFINSKNLKSKEDIIRKLRKNYGFQYKKEFRTIVVEIVGSVLFEKIETSIENQCHQLAGALGELKSSRDVSAHTYTKSDSRIDAPSKTLDLLSKISNGLAAFNAELYKLDI